jgi:hypothetical protein
MNTPTVEQMSTDEKLRAMEALWASLIQDKASLESPDWHQRTLKETALCHDAGQESPIDWSAAKHELRQR